MRVCTLPEVDEGPPPPYSSTPYDPSAPLPSNVVVIGSQTSLRGGYMRPSLPSESPSENSNLSAAAYFESRQPSIADGGLHLNLIEHNITFSPDTTRDDVFFPLPVVTWNARDVTSDDWSTFVNYLFPMLERSASEKTGNEKGINPRAFVEEDTPQRRKRIETVVGEWNEKFFSPRLIYIDAEFAPTSSRSIPINADSSANGSIPVNRSMSGPEMRHRSHSLSSTSSSSSSSSSSVDSIKSKDLEGANINSLRSALLAFRLDPNKKNHLRHSVRQLRDEFRSQRCNLSHQERKDLKKEYRDQRKEIKREVKAVVKEVKSSRRADRKLRKAERKSRREGKRAEHRGMDRVARAQEKSRSWQERAQEQASRAQDRAQERILRAQERGLRAQQRATERSTRTREQAGHPFERTRRHSGRGWTAAERQPGNDQARNRETTRPTM